MLGSLSIHLELGQEALREFKRKERESNMTVYEKDLYDMMFENEECWVWTACGSAMLVSDASLMDC